MMKCVIAVVVVLLTNANFADEKNISQTTNETASIQMPVKPKKAKKNRDSLSPRERAERHEAAIQLRYEAVGGLIEKPNAQKGKIIVVNEQNQVPEAEIKNVIDAIATRDKINILLVKGDGEKICVSNASSKRKTLGADCAVFLTESNECPDMMITAPEGSWSIVNATAVCKNAKNDAFKKTRLMKMVERAYYCACGAMNSQYPGSLMAAVRDPESLDRIANRAPVDVIARTMTNLKDIGVTPRVFMSYRKAVEQGWAPQPTNEVQQAIWDKVHAPPANPMKIEFDPKKGR